MENASYQTAAVEFSKYRVLARSQILGDEDCNVDALVIDLFVRGSQDLEAVEPGFGCSVIKRCHGSFC